MRKGYKWAKEHYQIIYKDGTLTDFPNESCYSSLRGMRNGTVDRITIFNTKCDKTHEYHDEYLKYVTDMLKLDTTITDDSFEFVAFDCNIKNMLVCSLVRMLYEKLGSKDPAIQTHERFLEPLLRSGKSKYRNKLKRFCDFYKRGLSEYALKYWHDGHSWNPNETKIKSTQEFVASNKLRSVNGFFTLSKPE